MRTLRVPFLPDEIPFDQEDPLCFHVLTTLGAGEPAERRLLQLAEEGAEIAPPSAVGAQWGEASAYAGMRPRDIAAGDADYAFFTPLRPFHYSTTWGSDMSRYPALAFRASVLQDYGFAFRVVDLEPYYTIITNSINEDDLYEEEGPVDFEQVIADIASEDLVEVASCGTEEDAVAAMRLLRAYSDSLLHNTPIDPDLLPIDQCRYPEGMLPPALEEALDGVARTWRVFAQRATHQPFPDIVFHRDPPEILVPKPVPICLADWYRTPERTWEDLDYACRRFRGDR